MKAFTLLLLLAGLAGAVDKSSDSIKAAEKAWATATVADDEAALKKILAEDLTYTHSTGDTDSKTVFMANLKSGVRRYHKLDHDSDMNVRLYGNAAVVNASAQVETSMNGAKPTPAHLRFIHMWIFEGGRWQLVAHQSQRMAK